MKILLPLAFLVLVGLACSGGSNQSQSKSKPDEKRKINADVSLSTAGVVIKNNEAADLPEITVKLNLAQTGSDDGRAYASSLPAGKTVTLPYSEFTSGTARFDIRKTKVLTVYVKSGDDAAKLFLCPGVKCQPAS